MPITTRAEIARRAATLWPLGTVPYSMDEPRNDCSSFAAEVLDLPDPLSWNTVTLVTRRAVRPITFTEAEPGDLWGRMGPDDPATPQNEDSSGAAGHVAIITGTPRTRADGQWEVIEQTGPDGDPGPHRNVYRTRPAGYAAYRAVSTLEEDMALSDIDIYRIALALVQPGGTDDRGTGPINAQPGPVKAAITDRNLAAVEARLTARIDAIQTAGVDLDALTDLVAAKLSDGLAGKVADLLSARLAQ